MSALSAPLLATGSLRQSHGTDRTQLAAAAKQFEAIFVRQMLAAARKTHFDDGTLGGQGMDTFRTMQDEHFADLAADTGAFGLAKMIERQLSAQLGVEGSAGASPFDRLRMSSARAGVVPIPKSAQPEPVEGHAQRIPRGRT